MDGASAMSRLRSMGANADKAQGSSDPMVTFALEVRASGSNSSESFESARQKRRLFLLGPSLRHSNVVVLLVLRVDLVVLVALVTLVALVGSSCESKVRRASPR